MRNYDKKIINASRINEDYEKTNVWQISPCFDKIHSAVFPVELCKRVIQYYSFKGDLIFDPFAGSGTVGKVAKNLDRYFFLTEKDSSMQQRIVEKIGSNFTISSVTEFCQKIKYENNIS
jgi:DNA modification methylase